MKEGKLTITSLIDNALDELSRAETFLHNDEEAQDNMLIDDINSSLDRMFDINRRIEFALIIAVYVGHLNAANDYKKDCDNASARELYIQEASNVDFEYDEDGFVDSEWVYNEADRIARTIYAKL